VGFFWGKICLKVNVGLVFSDVGRFVNQSFFSPKIQMTMSNKSTPIATAKAVKTSKATKVATNSTKGASVKVATKVARVSMKEVAKATETPKVAKATEVPAHLVSSTNKKEYRQSKIALTKSYKDLIGSPSEMIKYIKKSKEGKAFTSQFVCFNEVELTPANLFSVAKDTEKYLTQRFELPDGTNETRVSYDEKGNPMDRVRFQIGTIEKLVERYFIKKYNDSQVAKATFKKGK
jgi:lysyl-tRNA synthetase class II